MEKRWSSIKLTLLLLYLGVLPLTPEVPLPFAFVLLALAMVAAVPLVVEFVRTLTQQHFCPAQSTIDDSSTPGIWQLLRPITPGASGTVRSRAPSVLIAAHG